MSKESMEVLAKMSDIAIGVREMCNEWLLITYDIPHTPDGDIARRNFLAHAHAIGATRHTDSVYLMPFTPESEALALRLATAGKVVVWTSKTTNPELAKEVTRNYDENLSPLFEAIEERIDKILDHLMNQRKKRAAKMLDKTGEMLDNLDGTVARRGSAVLMVRLNILRQRYAGVYRAV